MALAVRGQTFAFPHTEFNGDRIKKTIGSFLYIFPYVAPYDSLYFSSYFFPVKRPRPSEAKKLHFHIQNLTVIEPKKGTIFSFLYIFPYVAPYDSLYFCLYFFPVKGPLPSETNNLHFHIQNLTVIEPTNGTICFFLYIFPYVALYDSLYFSPYFFPVKRPWPSEAQNLHFHIQNLTVIEQKKDYCFIPLYLPLCRPL